MDAKTVFKEHAKTFSFAATLLPQTTHAHASELYAFCRYCDDLADNAVDDKQKTDALLKLDAISGALSVNRSDDVMLQGMIKLINHQNVPLNSALNLLEGIKQDLGTVRIRNQPDLIQYAYQVAGTVGEMMCPILGCVDAQATQYACHLGVAMQLTNIVRDVMEDAKLNRLYLPVEWLGFDDPGCVLKKEYRLPTQLAMKKTLNLAETYYQSACHGLKFIPMRSRFTVFIAMRLYRHIGLSVAKGEYEYWSGRLSIPNFKKITLASWAGFNFVFGKYHHALAPL
ncbi:phytoene/squalene synthase family protein [Legionella worsleiensis]|uniref:15-cis-phytoene synthase n=1 Tax=Legionella worsleiensis TaxID=45076 RepID=A0A0W1AEN2_9GAMM|nr:phytoene/squalene synthase family protein [Legionella worsleiensis]KTD79793.1 15-cis-phytoene synthase [Legionella worsleiensis]STY32304.1 Dehydrosqualene synthase [Legionella worsleiensis]